MSTLIYTPAITMVIDTVSHGLVDVSEDLIQGSLVLRENGSHSFRTSMNNAYRKYDGVFTPNDRVVIQLKRLKWLQVFAGYLDDVPYYSAYPRPIEISGQCPLKILRNWPWDATTEKSLQLIHSATLDEREAQDGGLAPVVVRIMNEVVGWPKEKIHIGRVPDAWFSKFEKVYGAVADDVSSANEVLGVNPIIAGRSLGATDPVNPAESVVADITSDMEIILLTIRTLESGGNYKAINKGDGKGDWATGAYQFVDSTWNNYGNYPKAYLAPPSVQDAKARQYVNQIISQHGNSIVNVPYGWYYPKVFSDPTLLDKVPAAGEGNKLTIRQYGTKWVGTYSQIYAQQKGTAPPTNSSVIVASPTSTTYAPGTTIPNGGSGSKDAIYPIPDSVQSLDYIKAAWGGYSNGQVPTSAMRYSKGIGWGHPAAVDALVLMLDAASKAGYDLSGACYRSLEDQKRGAASSGLFATPGHSIHGWGLAFDMTVLTSNSPRYHGYSREQFYDTPEYQWLAANAWRWGWGHPAWAQKGGKKQEPWHWEFLAFENFRNSPEAKPGVGFNPSSQGANPFDGTQLPSMPNSETAQLYAQIAFWQNTEPEADPTGESVILSGLKATMNDTPVLETISGLITVANRSFCSAPNGDFMAWFPDYWGEYNTAGRVNVELIELKDFTVTFSDERMVTHQFVESPLVGDIGGAVLPQGIRNAVSAQLTAGVATVEIPRFLEAILSRGSEQFPWINDPQALLNRFGARISRKFVGAISGQRQEFWYAVSEFTKSWASMFSSRIPVTFLPEIFPGMLLCVPELKVQFYVRGVTHSWNFGNDAGFTTEVDATAPSATDGSGFFLFPKGGVQPVRSTGTRGLFRS